MDALTHLHAEIERLQAKVGIAGARCIELEKERDSERARAEKAEADLLKVAHTIGIVHEPDTGPCWPGPIEEIVKAINDAKYEAREADAERARADRYLAAIVEYVHATAAEEQAEEVYTAFGSRMMDLSLPRVTEAEVNAAFMAVATARTRAHAATVAIRAIVEEARRG